MAEAQAARVVRIFLASPSADTLEARVRVAQVVGEIGTDPQYAPHVRLELRRWDDPARPVICDRSGNPQQDIVRQMGSPGECELVIGIFAHTMGGTLPADRFPVPPGRNEPWYCSEWEVEQGLIAQRAVWVFHDQRPLTTTAAKAKRESLAVSEYIEHHNPPGGPMREGFNPFKDIDDLADRLRHGLRGWLSRTYIEPHEDDAPHPPDTRRQRELAHLDRLIRDLSQHEPRYVPLSGEETPEQRLERVLKDLVMPSDFVLDAFGVDESTFGCHHGPAARSVVYQDVLEAYRALPTRGAVRRLAVLGEPGAGKTFSLGRIACELARKAREEARRPVPLLVALGLWTDADETLDAFIVRRSAPLLADDVQALRREGRLMLLLDAVNEIPPGQRSAKAQTIAELAGDERIAALVLSCRQRDFEAELKSRLAFDTLRLLPLRPRQVRDFLRQSLVLVAGEGEGERRAEDKFWQIAGGEAMREVWRAWERAGATFEQFWTAEEVPKEPNVNGATSWAQDQLWRDMRRHSRSLIRLAENPFLLTVMMQLPAIPPNRAQLFAGFLTVLHARERKTRHKRGDGDSVPTLGAWRAALVQVAEALQRVDGQAGDDGARTALARADWPVALDEAMRVFSIDASVLQVVEGDLRFTHQLLQESLAADVLLDAARTGRRPASDFWPDYRGWIRTGWEVVAEIAAEACAGDAAAQARLIDWLAACAPKVAADVWVHAGRPVLPPEMLARTRAQWLRRMTDVQAEPAPEARMAIGCWLGALDLDDRPGTGLRLDGVPDIDWVRIDDFEIGRFPVTNRQWQAFTDDGGYGDDRWWAGLAERMEPRPARWSEPTAPRETVSWYESVAYCRWLSAKLGAKVTLPTEVQWERVARGITGREFAWGNDWYADLANAEYRLGRTALVGLYPHGATLEGVQDMTGNVWEWCLNELEEPQNIGLSGSARRVLRGGSWSSPPEGCRASYRGRYSPDDRLSILGLRLVRGPIQFPGP